MDRWTRLRRHVERNLKQGGGSKSVKWNDGVNSALTYVLAQMDEIEREENDRTV